MLMLVVLLVGGIVGLVANISWLSALSNIITLPGAGMYGFAIGVWTVALAKLFSLGQR